MTTNFRLPTLRLGTSYDERVVPLSIPATLKRGSDKALAILDGADRAPHRLARIVRPVALLGVKTSESAGPVRVRMALVTDERATRMWDHERRRRAKEEPKVDDSGEIVLPDLSDFHRLLQINVQGQSRAMALLSHRPSDGRFTRTVVDFEIAADDIGDSGLLMFDFHEPASMPSWAGDGLLPDGLTGICVGRIELSKGGEPVAARPSTGRPRMDGREICGRNPGFMVINPPSDGAATRVEVTPHWADDERLVGRRQKMRHPLKYVRESTADQRATGLGAVHAEVVDAAGGTVLQESLRRQGHSYVFDVPAGVGPVYVRVRKQLGRGEPRPINWYVTTTNP